MVEFENVEVGGLDWLRREISSRRIRTQKAEKPMRRAKTGSSVLWSGGTSIRTVEGTGGWGDESWETGIRFWVWGIYREMRW